MGFLCTISESVVLHAILRTAACAAVFMTASRVIVCPWHAQTALRIALTSVLSVTCFMVSR
jgi:hypothetical protein